MPQHFTYPEELYDVYTELLRPLPLPIFRDFLALLTPPRENFPLLWHIALLTNLLLPFLATLPRKANIFDTTQDDLIKYYLPHTANATAMTENAKMSLLIEHILFYMWKDGRLKPSAALIGAVEKGIKARESKAIGDGRKRDKFNNSEEQSAKMVLGLSAERIRMLMGMMELGEVEAGAASNGHSVVDGDLSSSSQLSDITQTSSMDENGEGENAATPR